MPVLQVADVPVGGGRRQVRVTWQDGAVRRAATSTFAYQVSGQEAEKIRWYLEDYAEFPADPAPVLAADAETRLNGIGAGLFGRVFAGQDGAWIWGQVQSQLSRVRVEVDTDPAEAPGLPWELLRDPGSGTAVALGAAEFVRTHLQTARTVDLPEAAGDQLRVLLVICRPGGRDDVPFRSVASRLVRGGAGQMAGLHLDVLRPATYPRLAEVLRAAADAGRPYHVVHFDGHGTYLDLTGLVDGEVDEGRSGGAVGGGGGGGIGLSPLRYGMSVAGAVRPGQHGYLIFEDPDSPTNQQLADGPTLGRLLTATGVPVLVLNACRSAYSEAPPRPAGPDTPPEGPGPDTAAEAAGEGAGGPAGPKAQPQGVGPDTTAEAAGEGAVGLADDVHARIRAYGSLAAEVADAGVPGVVAMRYNVYVVTAAQYMADLYAHLLAGKSLGQAATAARRALADSPDRYISAAPVALQDWAVPVIYEAAPLTMLQPEQRQAPLIQLTPADDATAGAGRQEEMPRPPDAGFFGRDETLLALDRAFDTSQVVLLHAYAGAGKTTTAAEFARWYAATGGLDHPELGSGPVLWSSFEHHLPLDRLLDVAADTFSPVLEANGIHWHALTDLSQRRDLVLRLLGQVPVLWVWDNTEPVTGFPPGTPSAWTPDEQHQIAAFLRDLAQHTRCKVLLTSRRDERPWLGNLPARVQLPPMPMRESLQLARALAGRHGHHDPGTDWRPLLRYAAGNPLTITVLVGQALREGHTSAGDIEGFVARIRAGEADLEAGEDAALGRDRSLAASLSYGFTHAFTGPERVRLAVLHLFRDTIDADALRYMGDPGIAEEDAVPELAGLTREHATGLLDRAAAVGLLSPLGAGYYSIHPALPWYFTALYTTAIGPPGSPAAGRAARAYTHTLAQFGHFYHEQRETGRGDPVPVLAAEEGNLHHALGLALDAGHWDDALGCLQGLRLLYGRTGRDGEWARLLTQITPAFIDPATDGPLPGRQDHWSIITEYRVQLATDARDWPTATRLENLRIAWNREQAAAALAAPAGQLTPAQRNQIRNLDIALEYLGHILRHQEDPGCLRYYQEAVALAQRIQDTAGESALATSLGNTYKDVPGVRDLDEAERWYRHGFNLRSEDDRIGRASGLWGIGNVAYERFLEARAAGQPESALLGHLNAALHGYRQALDLLPADDAEDLAGLNNQLGIVYSEAGDTRRGLHYFQQSIKFKEARGDIYGAGQTRYNIALLLQDDGRPGDALHFARAAQHDLERIGPGAAQFAARTRDLITELEQASG
jgi:tetratricopeptide (TPR) repeat protein